MPQSRAAKPAQAGGDPHAEGAAEASGSPAVIAAAWGIGTAFLLLYLVGLARSLSPGDSPEFVTASWILGVPHPPGYPIYTLIGHLMEQLPIGSPSFRLGLLSAAADSLALIVVFLLLERLLAPAVDRDSDRSARAFVLGSAAIGAAALGISTAFWAYSLVPEVFALNNLIGSLLLLLGFEWLRHPRRTWLPWTMALLFGLGLAHQQTIVLLAPALGVVTIVGMRRRYDASVPLEAIPGDIVRLIGVATVLLLVGLLPYAYLPIAASADPALNWGDPRTLENFIADVTRSNYGSFTLTVQAEHGHVNEILGLLLGYVLDAFTPLAVPFAAAGAWWLWRRKQSEGLALGLAFIFTGPFFLAFANPSVQSPIFQGILQRFYILPSIPYAIVIGCGCFQVISWVRGRLRSSRWAPLATGLVLVLLAAPLALAASRVESMDRSTDRVALDYGIDILAPLEKNALLLTRGDENFGPIAYIQNVERVRRDVVALDVELLRMPTYVQQQRRAHPDVTIPFGAYDGGKKQSLNSLITANIERRSVYYIGDMPEESFGAGYDQLDVGLATKIVPKGQGPDSRALLALNPQLSSSLHYVDRAYPPDSWEGIIADRYGRAAFEGAYALQSTGRAGAEDLYRTAIRLMPTFGGSYKNLAILLEADGRNSEAADLLERYLSLSPDDPEASQIRTKIDTLRSPAP